MKSFLGSRVEAEAVGMVLSHKKRNFWKILSFIVIPICYLTLFYLFEYKNPGRNPDRYYHFAISRMTFEKGLIRTLPQADDLGWGIFFPEKEFLFHQVTTLGYAVNGDQGVVWVCILSGIIICILLVSMISSYHHPLPALALVVLFNLGVPYYTSRLFMVRPHMAAILCFIIITYGFLKQKKWMVLIGATAFTLSYHTTFIPIVCFISGLGTFYLAGSLLSYHQLRQKWKNCLLFLLFGCIVGIFINPYFPANQIMGWHHLKFALYSASPSDLPVGGELVPRPVIETLRCFFPHFIFLLFGGSVLLFKRKTNDINYLLLIFLFLMTVIFSIMTIIHIRASEYFVCSATVMIAVAVAQAKLPKWKVSAFFIMLLYFPISFFYQMLFSERNEHYLKLTHHIQRAIRVIQPGAAGEKIFNCEWILGGFILYERPDLKFVDLLDPRLLLNESPVKYKYLRLLKAGRISKPYEMIKEIFKANFLLSTNPDIHKIVERDIRFKLLYPLDKNTRVRIYAL
jgi:hypothetical protein